MLCERLIPQKGAYRDLPKSWFSKKGGTKGRGGGTVPKRRVARPRLLDNRELFSIWGKGGDNTAIKATGVNDGRGSALFHYMDVGEGALRRKAKVRGQL